MFWKSWSWSERIFSVLALGLVAAIFLPVFARARVRPPRGRCPSNLKQIGLAFAQYEQDYDENFPLASTGNSAYGWADALQPYLKSAGVYHCPAVEQDAQQDPRYADPLQGGYTDYPFNARLEGKSLNDINNVVHQIVSLDGNDGLGGTSARYCLTQIPPLWFQDEKSPLNRHLSTANYLFADGHVKGMRPKDLLRHKEIVF